MKDDRAVRRLYPRSVLLLAIALFLPLISWAAPTPAPKASAPVLALGGDFLVLKGLNVRSAPSAEAEVIGLLAEGSTCTAIERSVEEIELSGKAGPWVRIDKPVKGWVFGGFLEPCEAGGK